MKEIWKDIDGYEGKYLVSNLGRIKSLHYKRQKNNEKFLKPYTCKTNPYLTVKINYKNMNIHRLVAKAFLENPNNYPVVNHIDGNKWNNNVNNLEWCTYKHNTNEAVRIGLYDNRNKMMSISPIRSKEINMYDKNNELIRSFRDSVEAEIILKRQGIKVCSRNIRNVCCGKRKTAGGFIWRLKNGS